MNIILYIIIISLLLAYVIKVYGYHYVATYINDYNFETEWGMNMI